MEWLRLLLLLVPLALRPVRVLDNVAEVEAVLDGWRSNYLLWRDLLLLVDDFLNTLAAEVLQVAEASVVLDIVDDGGQVLLLRRRPDRLVHYVQLRLA